MSVKVMSWVFDHSESTGNERLVLLAIADHANDETWSCWPSVARLAVKAKVSERTVQRAIRSLVELGEIGIGEGTGPRGTHRYTVYPQGRQIDTPPGVSGATDQARGVTPEAQRGDTGDTRTIKNHQRTAEQQSAIDECPRCDRNGLYIPDVDDRHAPAVKCDHRLGALAGGQPVKENA